MDKFTFSPRSSVKLARLSGHFLLLLAFLTMPPYSFSQDAKTVEGNTIWFVKVTAEPSNRFVNLQYSVQEPTFVTIYLSSRTGEPFLVAVNSFKLAGKYSAIFDANDLPQGHYIVHMKIGDNLRNVADASYTRNPSIVPLTYTDIENNLHNGIVHYRVSDPDRSLRFYDSLMTYYPNYVNRYPAMEAALAAAGSIKDSASVFALVAEVDSLMHSPWTNFHLGVDALQWKRFYRLGLSQLEKAINRSSEVSAPFQESFVFRCYYYQAKLYCAIADTGQAEAAILRALDVFQRAPRNSNIVSNHSDFDLLLLLASIRERRADWPAAISLYKSLLLQDSTNTSVMHSLQRAYESRYGSDVGFDLYSKDILGNTGSQRSSDETRDVGKALGPFRLSTLDGKQYQSDDIKGKVAVIAYWAYWCGNCLPERPILDQLYREFKGKNLKILGFHFPIGRTVGAEEDKASIRRVLANTPTAYPDLILTEQQELNGGVEVYAVPTIVVIDRKGIIRHKLVGYDKEHSYTMLRGIVLHLLAE